MLTCKVGNTIINCVDGEYDKYKLKLWSDKKRLICPDCGGLYEYALSYLPGGSEIFGGTSDGNHAGFTESIDAKYYDLFTTQSPETSTNRFNACNNGPCYGYGLIETRGWFQSYDQFYDAAKTPFTVPWMELGGTSYVSFVTAGATAINFGSGAAHEYDGSRVIISK